MHFKEIWKENAAWIMRNLLVVGVVVYGWKIQRELLIKKCLPSDSLSRPEAIWFLLEILSNAFS